ncbi:MAG: hypothetical protein K2X27_07795, partial [Candidatus Obscuribacterales bacterium]|nr:hypothetical protein [Candidatus Obscuribacterales bacterium]
MIFYPESISKVRAILLLLIFLFAQSASLAAGPLQSHRGKAGVYLRIAEKEENDPELRRIILSNPLIDCIVLGANWGEIEREEGHFDFSKIKKLVADWSASGKHVLIKVVCYGQMEDDRFTPSWIYKKKDIRKISFSGGGAAMGASVQIPLVWDKSFNKYLSPFLREFAKTFDGDPRVWYIHPAFGHIGHLTAQPSKGGAAPLLAAGWTVRRWQEYCLSTSALYRSLFKK